MTTRRQAGKQELCSLVVYGSLMHPQERRRCDLSGQPAFPVIVAGYSRSFSQEPAWRRGLGDRRSVLAVHSDPAARLNAILIRDVPSSMLAELDHRERGYLRTPLDADQLSVPDDVLLPVDGQSTFVYVGRPERFNPALRPNSDYRDLCIAAAAWWGERFKQMFLETTLVAGRPLSLS